LAELYPIGQVLSGIAASSSRPDFEIAFSQIQNTIIRRVNDEIEKANNKSDGNKHKIIKLQRDGLRLAESLPLIEAYRTGNVNNQGTLQLLIENLTTLSASLGTDDDITQSELDAFTAQRTIVTDAIDNLFVYIHPDIVDGRAIQYLKDEIDTLNALAPELGSKSGLQANIDTTAAVDDVLAEANTALSVTQNTITLALDLEQNIQSKEAEILAEFTELTAVAAANRDIEIQNIKSSFANILTAISLTFEANANFATELNNALSPFQPEPGSILNLFT